MANNFNTTYLYTDRESVIEELSKDRNEYVFSSNNLKKLMIIDKSASIIINIVKSNILNIKELIDKFIEIEKLEKTDELIYEIQMFIDSLIKNKIFLFQS